LTKFPLKFGSQFQECGFCGHTVCRIAGSRLLRRRHRRTSDCSAAKYRCVGAWDVSPILSTEHLGYWRQSANERLGDPPQRWIQEPLVMEDPQEDPLAVHCFCVGYVAGVHCWEISLRLADPGNIICLSCWFIVGFLHCALSLAAQCIVIGPVCLQRAGGRTDGRCLLPRSDTQYNGTGNSLFFYWLPV